MAASISLMVVLPLEPVTAATGPWKASRFRVPSRPSARRVSATTSWGRATSGTKRDTSAAAAPLPATPARQAWPSTRGPTTATTSWPGCRAPPSVEAGAKRAPPCSRPPCSGSTSWLRLRASSMGGLPLLQRPGGRLQVGEGLAHAIDLLVVLVALAGQQQHVVHAGFGDQAGNGLAASRHEAHRLGIGEAGTDLVENQQRVLGARI